MTPLSVVATKSEAVTLGLTRYVPGKPCKYGHDSPRYVKRGDCVRCRDEIVKKWRSRNRQKHASYMATWRLANPDRARRLGSYVSASRRARTVQATPAWCHARDIRRVYEGCPDGFHVDHVVPLASKLVCGLHVHWNMQYLSALDNKRKGNKVSEC